MEAEATPEVPDEALMQRLRAGEEEALGVLMRRWELPLRRFLYRLLCNAGEADELAQETFVKLYFQREKFREGAAFSPWLFTIAANLARNRHRWWRRHPSVSLAATEPDGTPSVWEPADPAAGPAARALAVERAALVRAAVAGLPQDLREVVVLAEFEALPQAQIASVLGCTVKAVEMRLYRARERLRRALGSLAPG